MFEGLTLEERVARQEAIEAIRALKHAYLRACDSKDPEGVRRCFTEDADVYFEGLGHFHGRDEFVDYYAGLALQKLPDGRYAYNEMHVGHRGDISVLSDTEATGRWSLQFLRADLLDQSTQFDQVSLGKQTFTVLACEYEDAYVRVEGEWKMRASHSWPLTIIVQPLSDATFVEQHYD
jgi:uncharacterized protein (TIGR02246 family)